MICKQRITNLQSSTYFCPSHLMCFLVSIVRINTINWECWLDSPFFKNITQESYEVQSHLLHWTETSLLVFMGHVLHWHSGHMPRGLDLQGNPIHFFCPPSRGGPLKSCAARAPKSLEPVLLLLVEKLTGMAGFLDTFYLLISCVSGNDNY